MSTKSKEGDRPAQSDRDKLGETGQEALGRNLIATWVGEFIVVISGFVTPRLISDQLGTASLGVWDFAWSVVSYFRFLGLGLAGLNRYIALYDARRAHDKLRSAVSSAVVVQTCMAIFTMLIALLFLRFVPVLFKSLTAAQSSSAGVLIVFIGLTLVTRMVAGPARGILTGRHRWALNAGITASGDILSLITIVIVLLLDGGLADLGGAYLAVTVLTEFLRTIVARHVYGERIFSPSAVNLKISRELVKFGIKSNLIAIPSVIVMQTVSIIITATTGPASLAIFARPLALSRHIQTLVGSVSMLLTPTVGSMQGLGQIEEIRQFFLDAMRASAALSLPLCITFAVYGDALVRLWMGDDFIVPWLNALIAAGAFLPTVHLPTSRILAGLNRHGRIAIPALFWTCSVLTIGTVCGFLLGWTPRIAAIVWGASLTAGSGVCAAYYSCKELGVPLTSYLLHTFRRPILCNLPFAAIILAPIALHDQANILEILPWGFFAGVVLASLYWRYLLSETARQHLLIKIGHGSATKVDNKISKDSIQ